MKLVPKKDWLDLNHMLVLYGRRYCPARPHDHSICPLSRLTPGVPRL
jgi:endonuclease III